MILTAGLWFELSEVVLDACGQVICVLGRVSSETCVSGRPLLLWES